MSRGAVILVLLSLLLIQLTSCRLTKQERRLKKDSELIEKIQGRSPELFSSKADTTNKEDTFQIKIGLEKDYENVRKLLDEYVALDKAKKDNYDSVINLEQKALRQQILISRQLDIERALRKGAFKKTEKMFKGDNYNLRVLFDPSSEEELSLSGLITHQIITNTKTITIQKYIFKEPTGWQAVKKLWPFFLVSILICVGAIIKTIRG
jgi:hypothetical protein